MASYIQESLSSDERVEAVFPPHWAVWIPIGIWILLALPTLGLTLIPAGLRYLSVKSTEHGLTNKRVIIKTGFISRKTQEMRLAAIETVEIDQGVIGRILGFGAVKVTGVGISEVVLRNIADPMSVKRRVESMINPSR